MQAILIGLIVGFLAFPNQSSGCFCKAASKEDKPHGANELIEYSEQTVQQIKGRVIYGTGEPVADIVVEVYKYSHQVRGMSAYALAHEKSRVAACITGPDGKFCFGNLRSGDYALRVGTRSNRGGMNEAYVKVRLDQRKLKKSDKGIEIGLTPGT